MSRAIMLGMVALAALAGCAAYAHSVIFEPDFNAARVVVLDGTRFTPMMATTADGLSLTGLITARLAEARGIVVFFHGNNLDALDQAHLVAGLPALGYQVIVADYRGYGADPGRPSEAGLMLDGQAFAAYAHQAAPDLPVILIGHSLGAAVALHCAATLPVAGLITVGAFSSLSAMVPAGLHLTLPEHFDNLALAPRIRVPWVLVHSRADDIIPYAQGQALARAAASDPGFTFMTVDAIGHNDLERVLPEALAALAKASR